MRSISNCSIGPNVTILHVSKIQAKFVNCKFLPGLSPQIFVSGAHPAKYHMRKVRKNTLFYEHYIIF